MAKKDIYGKYWITKEALEVLENYEKGGITIRGLYYQLVARGMTNSDNHYKRVVNAMGCARREGLLDWDTFVDHDRAMIGETKFYVTDVESEVASSKRTIEYWMDNYWKNRWENQEYYPEILIEKKALQIVFEPVCRKNNIALGACKGYPSLTFVHEMSERMHEAKEDGKTPIILYFGDYDPSGEDIPRSIKENLLTEFKMDIEVRRIALMEYQVIEWSLPPAPTKSTDSRSVNWDGLGQVELDAVEPRKLQALCQSAIDAIFDQDLYQDLITQEKAEREEYKRELKQLFINE